MKKIFFILFLALVIGGFFFFLAYGPSEFDKQSEFEVSGGSGASKVAAGLKERGLIRNELVFKLLSRFYGLEDKLVAGKHLLPPRSSSYAVLKLLSSQENSDSESNLTIIEGWKISDIADYLEEKGMFGRADFLEAAKISKWRSSYSFLSDSRIKSLEGYLFPDTYSVYKDAKPEDVIKKMLDNFQKKVTAKMVADLKSQERNLHDAIILASIVEREALYEEDRYMISDVFLKRLDKGMGLQSDATVNYVTGKKNPRPSYADLQIDSPYNTYKYRGLPPGSISNPGISSIMASIYPKYNSYYYFLTDSNGRAHFGKTYEEHQANIAEYLEK